jgi:hypothetical protein
MRIATRVAGGVTPECLIAVYGIIGQLGSSNYPQTVSGIFGMLTAASLISPHRWSRGLVEGTLWATAANSNVVKTGLSLAAR